MSRLVPSIDQSAFAPIPSLLTGLVLAAGFPACSREPRDGEATETVATVAEDDACCPPGAIAASSAEETAEDACCPPGEDGHGGAQEGAGGHRHDAAADSCSAHRVAESRCALCLPSLAPALLESSELEPPGERGPLLRLGRLDAAARSGLHLIRAAAGPARATVSAFAEVVADQDRVARLTCPAGGVVVSISADPGREVRPGEALAVLRSPEIARARGELREAVARLRQAESEASRQRRLRQEGLLSERDFLEGEKEVEVSRAAFDAAERRLRALTGTTPDPERCEVTDRFVLTSPIPGIVVSREAMPGQTVGAETVIATVTDPRRLWIDLGVRETDAPLLRVGQTVRLVLDARPGESFAGTVTAVPPSLDPHSRTLRVRASIDNSGGRLLAGMFGRAEIEVGSSAARSTIPEIAVQRVEDQPVAFVRLEEDLFELRRLQLGRRNGGRVEVFAGLEPGELVVADGAFLLKTEVSKGSIGAGCCDHVEALGRQR